MKRKHFLKKLGAALGLVAAAPQVLEGSQAPAPEGPSTHGGFLVPPDYAEELAAHCDSVATSCSQVIHDTELTAEKLIDLKEALKRADLWLEKGRP